MHHCHSWRMKDQLDVTCYFISLIMRSTCSFCRLKPAKRTPPNTNRNKSSNTQRTENKMTDVVIHKHSRKLLKMDILMSETCWAHNKWNKIASDIKLVFHSSTMAMMHGPINNIYIYTHTHTHTHLCIHTCNTQNVFTIIIHYRADSQSEHLNVFLLFLCPAVGLSASCEATLLM